MVGMMVNETPTRHFCGACKTLSGMVLKSTIRLSRAAPGFQNPGQGYSNRVNDGVTFPSSEESPRQCQFS